MKIKQNKKLIPLVIADQENSYPKFYAGFISRGYKGYTKKILAAEYAKISEKNYSNVPLSPSLTVILCSIELG